MTFESVFASLNIALIAGIFGALLLGLGIMKIYKTKETKKMANLFGVLLVGVLFVGAFVPQADFLVKPIDLGGVPAVVTPGVPTPGLTTICAVEDTTITLSAINKFTTVSTGGDHRYRINGAPAKTVSDAGSFTASPGDALEILWMNASTSSSYFSDVSSVVVPCKGTKIFDKELYQNGTITIQVFNEEGNVIDASNNETLAAGDVVTLDASIKVAFQKGLPYGGIMVCEYNSTVMDDCIVDFGGEKVLTPSIYTITFATDSATKSYTIPPVFSTLKILGTIVLDVDDSNVPIASPSDVTKLTLFANNYYIDEDLGGAYGGPAVEDEDGDATYDGLYEVLETIYIKP